MDMVCAVDTGVAVWRYLASSKGRGCCVAQRRCVPQHRCVAITASASSSAAVSALVTHAGGAIQGDATRWQGGVRMIVDPAYHASVCLYAVFTATFLFAVVNGGLKPGSGSCE